jgi:hypothetical protein
MPFTSETINILYAGGYSEDKGVDDLINAFLTLDTSFFKLNLVGPVSQRYIALSTQYPSIFVKGVLTADELYSAYADADIVVSPHRRIRRSDHVFPHKIIEYIASGALPLVTPMPGTEAFQLPAFCYFTSTDQLAYKLRMAPIVWPSIANEVHHQVSCIRSQYSFESIHSSFAAHISSPSHPSSVPSSYTSSKP